MRSPLRYRDFSLYVVATVATAFAIEMAFVAIGWQVYSINRNPLDLGLVGLAMFLPLPLLALPAGHLADRYPRRTVLAVAIALDAVVALGLLAVTRAGADETWPFFLLAFGTGVASALGAPSGRALVPSLVPQELLVRAFAQRSAAFQASVICGPALGGLLFAIHPELVYAVAAGFSVVALVAMLALRAGREGVGGGSPDLASVLGGVRLVRRTPVLLGAISLDLFAVLFGGAVALLPVFARDVLEVGPAGLGVLRSAPAVGALVAAIVMSRWPVRRRAGGTLLTVVAAYGVTMIVFGLSQAMWLSLVALAAGGAVDMVSVVLRQTILPLVTPDELRGRVNAVEMVFISASNELGAFESGVAAALVGAVPAVVIGGVVTDLRRGRVDAVLPRPAPRRPPRRAQTGRDDRLAPRAREQPGGGEPAKRRVEQLDRVQGREGPACPADRLRDLDEAARVRACVDVRLRREDVRGLPIAELPCRLGLGDVVDPGGPATELLLGRLEHGEPGDALQHRTPGRGQALRVTEVTGVLVGDRELERVERRQLRCGERLGHVERRHVVILQVRAAPRRVDDDRVHVGEARAESLREPRRLLRPPGVRGQRAAAALRRRDHLVPGCSENARRRGVDVAEEDRLDAAREKADAASRLHLHVTSGVTAAGRSPERHAGATSSIGFTQPGEGSARPSGARRIAHRMRRGYGSVAKSSRRCIRSPRVRGCSASTTARVSSISRS